MSVLSFAQTNLPTARPFFRRESHSSVLSRSTRRALSVPAPESFALAALCLLDLSSTIFWVSYRNASEGNPIMAYYLTHGGTLGFVLAKMVLFIMPLVIAEWARTLRPQFVRAALRVGIAGYLGLYAIGVAHINQTEAEAADWVDVSAPSPVFPAHKWTSPVPGSGWNPAACGTDTVLVRIKQDEP